MEKKQHDCNDEPALRESAPQRMKVPTPCATTDKMENKVHTPYAGIILFRFKGTFSARPAQFLAKMARTEASTGTPKACNEYQDHKSRLLDRLHTRGLR